jgi:serine/threonine protein kinase
MEYMPGGSLEDALQQKHHLPLGEVVRIARQVCEGLSYAHDHGIIHCDLKPANILFGEHGTAKVADFGIAHVSSLGITTDPLYAGTWPYMSPEQIEGERSDPRIDLYALGATLYHALTGRTYADFGGNVPPFDLIRHHQPEPPSIHDPLVPPWLDDLVLQLLEKRPEDRPDTAAKVCARLRPRQTQPLPPGPPSSPPKPSRLPKWTWYALLGALLAVVLVVVLWVLLHKGDRIAFASGKGSLQICVMNADGSGQRCLTNNGSLNESPAWSPDGTRLAFHSWQDGDADVYRMNADGTELKILTNHPDADGSPSWSTDGNEVDRIVFDSNRDGNMEIYVMDADGSGATNLTNHPEGSDQQPAWSPVEERIAFMSDRDGDREIYVMNADGSNQTRLTNQEGDDQSPAWSPDGKLIAFFSERDGNNEIYVMNADGSGVRRLTNNFVDDRSPCWSPDGESIAFESYRDENWEIYVMNADGSEQVNLTNSPVDDRFPAWWGQQ